MLFDQYVAAWTPIVVAILTCVAVCWVYGMPSLINNVRAMLGSPPSLWWQTLWKFVTPVILMVSQGGSVFVFVVLLKTKEAINCDDR